MPKRIWCGCHEAHAQYFCLECGVYLCVNCGWDCLHKHHYSMVAIPDPIGEIEFGELIEPPPYCQLCRRRREDLTIVQAPNDSDCLVWACQSCIRLKSLPVRGHVRV